MGLFSVAEDNRQHHHDAWPVDIIAIHGLNGKAFSTWTHPVSGNMWLRDNLPSYVPGCRVYTFGYASKVRDNPSVASIPDFARGLLDAVRNLRQGSEEVLDSLSEFLY
jgi:hypothetical protein